jgi:hypothetical protein
MSAQYAGHPTVDGRPCVPGLPTHIHDDVRCTVGAEWKILFAVSDGISKVAVALRARSRRGAEVDR